MACVLPAAAADERPRPAARPRALDPIAPAAMLEHTGWVDQLALDRRRAVRHSVDLER